MKSEKVLVKISNLSHFAKTLVGKFYVMTGLSIIFLCKILLTAFCWSLPLLVIPEALVIKIGIPIASNIIFLRLLGMAYTALLVGYIFAFNATLQGEYPLAIIGVGIVSNGGASIILLIYGILGYWKSWGTIAKNMMWFSMLLTALITIGLVITGLKP